jgi:CDP-glucose 4,6-dehydratase
MAAQSLVRRSYRNPVETYETNVIGTVNVLEACRRVPSVRVLVNITSDKCYRNYGSIDHLYKEDDPLGGSDPYSSSKACSELITAAYAKSFFNHEKHKNHFPFVASARAGNVIGGGDWSDDRLIPDCIKALIHKGAVMVRNPYATRPWQHVLDPLLGYLLLAKELYTTGVPFVEAWNFGPHGEDVKTVQWLVEHLLELWGSDTQWLSKNEGYLREEQFLQLDSSKAKSKLGWLPPWDLQEALRKTVEWYKAYSNNDDMLEITIGHIKKYEMSIDENIVIQK